MNLFELFVKIGVDDQASDKISSITKSLGTGLATAAKVGTAAVAAVGGGIAALGTYAAKVGSDFEAQMSKVSAISGATGDDLQALGDKAKQLGIDTKFSATEAGQAFEYMAMAGWKTEQMLDGVSGIMDLAAASGENLALVSDIVTDAMTAFGLSADQSTHFADVLAQASSNANTNVALLGESFKYVAPVAGALGYSIEDTATALGLMANAGIKGSQAGTALRAALSSMLDASTPTYMAMMQLGLATEDTVTALVNEDGTSKSLAETMGILRDAFSELTEAEQAEYASTIFGREAMSGMLAIINTSDEEFEKLTNSIYSADGAAKDMAATMANNLQGQLTLLKSSAEGFGLALYDKIQVPLTEMASWAVDSLNQLTTAFNENGVDGLVNAAGNILSEAINEIVNGLPKIVDLAIQVIHSFIGGLNDNLDTIVSGAISVVMTLANGILSMLPEIIALGLELITSLALGIAEAIPELVPTIIDVVLQIVDTLTAPEQLTALLDAAFVLITALMDAFLNPESMDKVYSVIFDLVDNLVGFLLDEENLSKIIQSAIQIVIAIGTGMLKQQQMLAQTAIQLFGAVIEGIFTTDWVGIGADVVNGIWEGLKDVWEDLKAWFTESWEDLVGGVKDLLGIHSPSRVFAGIGQNMALGVGAGWQDEFGEIQKQIDDSMHFETGSVDFASSGMGKASAGVINTVTSNTQSVGGVQTVNLMLPDNTTLARYYLQSFIDTASANGTPILNPA